MNEDHTREAEVELLAAVRAEVIRASDDPPLEVDVEAHFAEETAEEAVDPGAQEITRSGRQLLADVRAEVDRVRHPAGIVAQHVDTLPTPVPHPAAAMPDAAPPPPVGDDPAAAARWAPPPRLKPAPTPRAAPLVVDSPRPARHLWRWVLGGAAAVALAVVLLIALTDSGSDDSPPPASGDGPAASTTVVP
jgi:hypothetical protein